jgi:antitoxin component YwqK of YwqJK toxin-antitoxin module
MKVTLFALFISLLLVGCEESSTPVDPVDSPKAIDWDDPETREKIIAEAIDYDKIQKRDKEGERLGYAPNEQTPYTGWGKVMHDNGQIKGLAQFKDGKPDGLETLWDENGQKEGERNYKDGKLNGLETIGWYENGQKKNETTYKDGKKNGLRIFYNPDGTEDFRLTYKDGKEVSD